MSYSHIFHASSGEYNACWDDGVQCEGNTEEYEEARFHWPNPSIIIAVQHVRKSKDRSGSGPTSFNGNTTST
jgi:hypothetical protein